MEQNALSEALKGMSAISVAFKNFYPVVETFTGSIGVGVFLFLMLKILFDRLDISGNVNFGVFLEIADKYSYEVYLVHQFLILGPFSLMMLTPLLPLNIIIILIGIVFLAMVLKMAEVPILKRLAQ